MNTRAPFRTTLVGLAVGVLLALLIAPQSRWLVRYQLALVGVTVGTPPSGPSSMSDQTLRIAAAHPNDYQMQLAAQQNWDSREQRERYVAYLRTLTPRFGNNPSLYANLLRYEIGGDKEKQGVHLARPEEHELEAGGKYNTLPASAPALLAAFDADAAQGERLDPSNAYFPLMHAISLFAARRDAEGLAAVQRASTKPVWNEYVSDETNGRLRLADAAYGHAPSISRVAITAAALYPQYAPLRAVARIATVLAMHAEQSGDPARGMSIRRALMQDGDLMRVQAQVYIGNLVGIAISATARSRPGGSEAAKRPQPFDGDQWARMRLEAFARYARQAGFPDDAARAEAQYAAGETVRRKVSMSLDHSIFSPQSLNRLAAGWIGGTLALVSAFWLLVLGGVGALLSRLPSVRNRQPLPSASRWGAATAVVFAVSIAVYNTAPQLGNGEISIYAVFLLTIIVVGGLPVGALILLRGGKPGRQKAAAFVQAVGVTALMLMGLTLVAAWQTRGILKFVQVQSGISGLSGDGSGGSETSPLIAGLIVAGIGLIVPAVLAIALSIRARIRRVPAFAALASGFRRVALPLACVLIIGYGAAVLGTLREEQRMDNGLRQMISHEGRYYAALAGAAWPGPA